MKTKFYLNYLRYLKQLLVLCLFLLPVTEGFSQAANLDIRVTGPGEAEPGDELSYTISYSNIGAVLANNVVIELSLPAGNFVYAGSTPAGVESGGKITWTKNEIPQLEQLNTGIYSITVNLIAGNPGQLTNSSEEEVTAYSILNDTETLTLSATIKSTEVTVPVESNVVTTEISRRCTFSISNPSAGIKSATNSTLTYLLALVNTGNVYEKYNLTSNYVEGQDLIRKILPMDSDTPELEVTPYIAPGEIFFFRYRLQTPGGTKPNEYSYTSITATPVTCGAGANVVTTFIYGGQYDDFDLVSVYKIDTPDPVQAGSQLSYKIIICNVGEDLANVYLTETYPLNTSFVSANPPASNFNNQWHFPMLPQGNTIIDVVLNVQNNIANGTELTNTVAISDVSQTYSIFQEKTTVLSAPDLAITKTADKIIVFPGDEVVYTINYTNIGNRTAIGLTLTDDYNEDYMTVLDAGSGTDSEPAGLLSWSLPDLASGASATITYTLKVDDNISNFPVGSTNILNIAVMDVDPTRPDADLNNNQSYAVVTVQNVPDLVVDIVSDADPVEPETQYTYTITVSNVGEVAHSGHPYTVTAYLPESATYLSNSAGGIHDPVAHTVSWTVNDPLLADGSVEFTITMQAPDCDAVNSVLSVKATAYSNYWVDANPDDNEATLNLTVEDQTVPVISLPDVANPFPMECNQNQSGVYDQSIQFLISLVQVSDNCDFEPLLNHDYMGFTQACGEDLVITFTAIDASGNTAEPQTLTISFVDDAAPVINLPAAELVMDCFDAGAVDVWTSTATATDNCDGDVTVTASYTQPTTGLNQSVEVTFASTDACGNTAMLTKSFTINDQTVPVISLPDVANPFPMECNQNQSGVYDLIIESLISQVQVSDNCDMASALNHDYTADFTQGCGEDLVITFTAVDANGNVAVPQILTISFYDDAAPVINLPAAELVMDCFDAGAVDVWTSTATATDNCDGDVTVTASYTQPTTGLNQSVEVTFASTDACGNTAMLTKSFTINDQTVPVISLPDVANPFPMECNQNQSGVYDLIIESLISQVQVSDNCDMASALNHDYTGDFTQGCGEDLVITFTAVDANGNVAAPQILTISFYDDAAPVINLPVAELVMDCFDAGAVDVWTSTATATDNCDGDVTVTASYTQPTTGLNQSVEVTFASTDACGNTAMLTKSFTINDQTVPVISLPDVANPFPMECNQNQSGVYDLIIESLISQVQVSDNCDMASALNHDYTGDFTQGCGEDLVITFTAVDANGNVAAPQILTISFYDDAAPVINLPAAELVMDCFDAGAVDVWTSTATATDNCDGDVTVTASYTQPTTGLNQSVEVTFASTDACGNTAMLTKSFTINDQTVPVISLPDVANPFPMECNQNQSGVYDLIIESLISQVQVSDNCDMASALNHDYTGDFTQGCGEDLVITFTAVDANGNVAAPQILTISFYDDAAPVINLPAAELVMDCFDAGAVDVWTSTATATDNCDGDVTVTASYTQPTTGLNQSVEVTFASTDACGNTAMLTKSFTINDQTVPVISLPDVANPFPMECNQNQSGVYDLIIESLISQVQVSDNCDIASALNHDYTGDFTQGCGEDLVITFTAVDANGNVAAPQILTISFYDDAAPVINLPVAELVMDCFDAGAVDVWTSTATATDNCDGDVTVTASYTQPTTGLNQSVEVTFASTDACGNTAMLTKSFTINDQTVPVISLPDVANPFPMECNQNQSGVYDLIIESLISQVQVSDNCDMASALNHDYTGDFTQGCGEDLVITFTAVDANGNVAAPQILTISFYDDVAPVLTAPAPLVLNCEPGTDYRTSIENWLESVTVDENCDAQLTINNDYDTYTQGCGEEIVVTFTAADACSNAAVPVTSTITFIDNIAPVITAPQPLVLTCDLSVEHEATIATWLASASVSDNCDSYISVENNYSAYTQSCNRVIVVTFTASDICGNEAMPVTSTISFIDLTDPVITFCPPNLTIEGDESSDPSNTGMATADDDCDTAPSVTYADQIIDGPNAVEYTIRRTWTATDDCGNSTTCVQLIDVVDTTPPDIVCPLNPSTILVDWDLCQASGFNLGTPVVSDNLNLPGDIQVHNDAPESFPIGTTVITWTAVDEAGNTATCTQTIIVPDIYNVEVPTGFSPNGDGINEYFRIHGMCLYPDARIEIFSRWGAKVYEKDRYGNTDIYGNTDAWWDGRANVNGKGKEILPAGTYFYVLKLSNSEVRKGAVYINR
ncbi:gliding motility-associated C-terminal domain-containing protein [Gaoshiqia sp. Z1-71]|uniref:T9SS type B sorting domain-containing protein n=1 Tax=Gaoshiqia hydrogeniformans TaxID=3290090 RepID=UPI003BF78777